MPCTMPSTEQLTTRTMAASETATKCPTTEQQQTSPDPPTATDANMTADTPTTIDTAKEKEPSPAEEKQKALDNNQDYQATLKALELLQHQLRKAMQDVNTLTDLKKEALSRPFEFLSRLKDNSFRQQVPRLQKIACCPNCDWTKYRIVPESRIAEQTGKRGEVMEQWSSELLNQIAVALEELMRRNMGTTRRNVFRGLLDHDPVTPTPGLSPTVRHMQRELQAATQTLQQMKPSGNVSDTSDKESEDESVTESGLGKGKGVRRMSTSQSGSQQQTHPTPGYFTPSTSKKLGSLEENNANRMPTHNQPWTDEEQKRLEELLEIYPDEPVQSQRFNKIAEALGTRSARQVASRVQKYFIKLARLGLPVPGRITIPPSRNTNPKRGRVHKVKSRGGASGRTRPSMRTSGVGYNTMVSGGITSTRISGAHYLTTQGPPSALMSDDEEDTDMKEMIKATKGANESGQSASKENGISSEAIHEGYACDNCGLEPIVGVRYKCTVCDVSEEIDLCGKCMAIGTFQNDHHTPDHPFEAIHKANALPYYADNDYTSPDYLGEYGYLGY